MTVTLPAIVAANEIHNGLLHMWRYRLNLAAQLAMFAFLFVGIAMLSGRGHLDTAALPSVLVGFVVWYYAFMAIGSMSVALAAEAQTGTLEQAYLSPAPPALIFAGRALATFVSATIMGALLAAALVLVLRLRVPIGTAAVPVLLITLAGVFGFGLMIGGATLAFKRADGAANLVQNMLLFLNGTLLPVEEFPRWLGTLAGTLPTTLGISALRRVTVEQAPLLPLWRDGTLPLLALHSAAYLGAGWLIFRWCERHARQHGTLGHY